MMVVSRWFSSISPSNQYTTRTNIIRGSCTRLRCCSLATLSTLAAVLSQVMRLAHACTLNWWASVVHMNAHLMFRCSTRQKVRTHTHIPHVRKRSHAYCCREETRDQTRTCMYRESPEESQRQSGATRHTRHALYRDTRGVVCTKLSKTQRDDIRPSCNDKTRIFGNFNFWVARQTTDHTVGTQQYTPVGKLGHPGP